MPAWLKTWDPGIIFLVIRIFFPTFLLPEVYVYVSHTLRAPAPTRLLSLFSLKSTYGHIPVSNSNHRYKQGVEKKI